MIQKRLLILSVAAMGALLSSATMVAQCTADAFEEDDACIPSKTVIHGGDTQSHNFCDDTDCATLLLSDASGGAKVETEIF